MVSKIYLFLKNILNIIGIYVVWIVIHYISSQLYVQLCVPYNFCGFLLSPILVPSIHCQALRWCIYNGGNTITQMWLTIGSWLVVKLIVK